jgi:hypothetical protein
MIKQNVYTINNLPITNDLLVSIINKFWLDTFESIKDTNHLLILCKANFSDGAQGYRTLGHLRKVNFDDKDLFIDYLQQRLGILSESYITQPISNITFSYIKREGLCTESNRALLSNLNDKVNSSHSFNNMVLPISMNPGDYGEIRNSSYIEVNGVTFHRFTVVNRTRIYEIDRSLDKSVNKVTILGNIGISWIDTKVVSTLGDIFKREIKKSTIYFMDGEVILRKQVLPSKAFRRLQLEKVNTSDFYTIDIETINQLGKLVPYLICAYNGSKYITSFGKDQKTLFTTFIGNLLSNIKPGTILIYAHNLSGFDGVFLLKHLIPYGKVEPILFNGKLMSIKLKIISGDHKGKTLIFKDSYLLLPLSLRKLCLAFNIASPKGYFPFKLANIVYTGVLPKFDYWTGISLGTYKLLKAEYHNKFWNFKDEAIKYCKLDCKTLHEIIIKFNELIFNHFSINAHSALTLPALAMRIYKTHFMPENTIYQLLGKAEYNIRESYTGGAVDVYIPHNRITAFFSKIKAMFRTLYYYDVNSLYPFVMKTFAMPIGKPIAFEGNIRKVDPNAFGFFNCKITSPSNLQHPILQRRIKTVNGLRTIAGLGSWTGWICSSEMDNAVTFGYQFEILNGYEFKKGDIFSSYVDKMYNLRLQF